MEAVKDLYNSILERTTGSNIWESFQHPSNAMLPNMKLRIDKVTGKKVKLTSWKSPSDPHNGSFSLSVERLSIPEVFIWNQTRPLWRTNPWNGKEMFEHFFREVQEIGLIVYGSKPLQCDRAKDQNTSADNEADDGLLKLSRVNVLDFADGSSLTLQPDTCRTSNYQSATNNFHPSNKLVQGDFGPVYKGQLHDCQEIAVKRLSRASGQDLEEFINEVVVISKLQESCKTSWLL
ncbi:hypothetical protein JHK85_051469 [Glycine max]|nr:hypothetical protein JHK85_051469 [Glycine max]